MANQEQNIKSVLNDLIETCKDGEQGFRTAAEKAKGSSLKALLTKFASQRGEYATELQTLVASVGEDPATSGHIAGTIHRGWINLKEALSKNEDKALIEECEAGEDAAVKHYEEALSKSLPANVMAVIRRQFSGIQEGHMALSNLKHGRAATA